ncbi:amino acid ABC transporter, periplasmic binding protein [Gottschalkia acidurici 9a]|uniref:Amino acid ABC transporter, periplasmic binding protein n=1 Tax=Gottschalkia acidurici (strain ATCC 7906 / DSM 604 / BCRC 14475 / CIP 104303 / KCTC 5404 / NCIMB 10678 / 9a) TaxID=1128398 RepID=K0B4H7_GOTA9|nr:cysteine ABC transporter substrate-binding protein [Gottschalkia acidurici]AFS79436.1 amino acid ABC transporter, periplasmic binding protein [Gottschalkia acidurici 9a]
MRSIKKFLALLIIGILAIGSFTGCSKSAPESSDTSGSSKSASSIEEIKNRGIIRIGVFSDKPPFGYIDAQGENQGFDIYIAKRFAKDLLGDESKAEFVLVEAANRVAYLESNKVDIIMANFTVTDERKQKVDFANPYMKVSLGLVSPDNAQITSVDQLKGKKLIVNKGTTAETYFTKNHPEIELLKFDQNTEAFEALKDNRGAALAHDNTEVLAWAKSNTGFTVGLPTLGSQDTIAPAVKKGDKELLDWINKELETIGKENFVHKAYEDTLKPVYGDSVSPDDLVIEGGKIN